MGGSAFSGACASNNPPICTPRMDPSLYRHLKSLHYQHLTEFFPERRISHLTESPQKVDFGDIDFIVEHEGSFDRVHQLAHALGAVAFIRRGRSISLAVRRDGQKATVPPIEYTYVEQQAGGVSTSSSPTTSNFAQIDIGFIPAQIFDWHHFYASYGGVAALLAQILNNLGFTVFDKGLLLRLKEYDNARWSTDTMPYRLSADQGRLLLSDDPVQVMDFLGLDAAVYHRGFETQQAFFDWLASCRMLTPDYVRKQYYRRADTTTQGRQIANRPGIVNFLEYLSQRLGLLPDEKETGLCADDDSEARETILHERRRYWTSQALCMFDKHEEYRQLQAALQRSLENQMTEHLLKPVLRSQHTAKEAKLVEIVRALRRWVAFNDQGQPYVLEEAHTDEESQLYLWLHNDTLKDPVAVESWVLENWAKCRQLERRRRGIDSSLGAKGPS